MQCLIQEENKNKIKNISLQKEQIRIDVAEQLPHAAVMSGVLRAKWK